MHRFALGFLLTILLPGLAAAEPSGPRSNIPLRDRTATVAGTTWAGTDSDGDYYEYHFEPGGVLHYRSPTGFFTEGATWKQDGNSIYMEMNGKYCEYRGRISGTRMDGNAGNVQGHTWTWKAEKK